MDPQEWAEAHAVQAVLMGPGYYEALWNAMDQDYAGADYRDTDGADDAEDTDE